MKATHRFIAALCSLAACTQAAWAAPVARLVDPYWARHDESSAMVVDHASWDVLLARYLSRGGDGIARLDYAAFSVSDKEILAGYVEDLSRVHPTRLSRAEQSAFWVNL